MNGITKINAQMHNRLKSHALKLNHLDLLFERELRTMKVYCFKNVKNKKYKALTFSLQAITEAQKKALLKQYFDMCKMLYRIRSVVSYNYYHENAEEMVKELYANDETFAKMIQIVHKNIINLFSGTEPDYKVIGVIE